MNNIHNSTTSAFLASLEPDKSQIKTVNPLVVFRRLLGVSEAPTARDIVAALQQASTRVGKLQEMQKNFSSPSLIGEIITFDIGPARPEPWMKFSVIREPLPDDGNQIAINFAVIVTDKANGKRYNRIIGAMSRETNKNGEKQTVFRLIKDICNIEDIPTEKPAEDGIVISAGTRCKWRKIRGHKNEVAIDNVDDDSELMRFTDPDVETTDWDQNCVRIAINDIKKSDFDGSLSDIIALFKPEKKVEPPKPAEKQKKEEPKPEPKTIEKPAEIVIHKDELVKFEETSDKVYKAKQDLTQDQVNDIVANNKIDEFFIEQLPEPPAEVPVPAEESVAEAPKGDAPLSVPGEEAPEPVPEDQSIPAAPPASTEMVAPLEEPVSEPEEPKKEPVNEATPEPEQKEEPMEEIDEIVYHAGDVTSFFGDDREYRIKVDVTRSMLAAAKGNVNEFAEVVEREQPAEAVPTAEPEQPAEEAPAESAPVGDIPEPKSPIRDEMSKGDFLRYLFGTANPNIMHLFSKMQEEVSNKTFKDTGTWPVEQMIVYPKYTFSVVKMKNGRFYRIFVAYTDMENLNDSTWLQTKDVKDRWLDLIDIQDRDVGRILDMRERRR